MSSSRDDFDAVFRKGIGPTQLAEACGVSVDEAASWDSSRVADERESLIQRIWDQFSREAAMDRVVRALHGVPEELSIETAAEQGIVPDAVLEELREVGDPVIRKIYWDVIHATGRDILFNLAKREQRLSPGLPRIAQDNR